MNNLISPYDLGNSLVVENCQKIKIDELVRNASKMLKRQLIEAQIEVLGKSISLITSKTRFKGERIWFGCPICAKRVGILFDNLGTIGCRKCFNLSYKKQRYRGMIEES